MSATVITSPVEGWVYPLDAVPDPVFAGRLLGDGVAIDPVGNRLCAPCDGQVIQVHAARHAVTMRTDAGAELLMHIGIDTVALAGNGFTAHVAEGEYVRRGDPLLDFDLDFLLENARAVITPILVTNPHVFGINWSVTGRAVVAGEDIFTIIPREALPEHAGRTAGAAHVRSVLVEMRHGVHARPAARIAEAARGFTAEIMLQKGDRKANARGAIGMLGLAIKHRDRVEVVAVGDDAEAAAAAIAAVIEDGMGEAAPSHTKSGPDISARVSAHTAPPPTAMPRQGSGPIEYSGVVGASGVAIGRVSWFGHQEIAIDDASRGSVIERARLRAAIDSLAIELAERRQDAGAFGAIAEAHLTLLDDPDSLAMAEAALAAGENASVAWRRTMRSQAEMLRNVPDQRVAERANDLLDLERRVIARLEGVAMSATVFEPDTILLAEDLLPSHMTDLKRGGVVGIGTVRGGPTSHAAILAASLGIPMLVALGEELRGVQDGLRAIIDADAGMLAVDPLPARAEALRAQRERDRTFREEAFTRRAESASTCDGGRIEIFANLASAADAIAADEHGAEGCGLLRTEFLFLDRAEPPDIAEQQDLYQNIADALSDRPVIVRLFDVGGDKPAPYLAFDREENPALGLRGVRVSLRRPDLLETQVRAILGVKPTGRLSIMVPMIARSEELLAVRDLLEQLRAELGIIEPVALGIMVETPAAAMMSDILARDADFFSIGSNDLTQYCLAMDRGNPAVASAVDGLDPSVLRLIAQTCAGAAAHGRRVGVCGGLASERAAAAILIGLGVTELSIVPSGIPAMKAVVRQLDMLRCRELARAALAAETAMEVRRLANAYLAEVIR